MPTSEDCVQGDSKEKLTKREKQKSLLKEKNKIASINSSPQQ